MKKKNEIVQTDEKGTGTAKVDVTPHLHCTKCGLPIAVSVRFFLCDDCYFNAYHEQRTDI